MKQPTAKQLLQKMFPDQQVIGTDSSAGFKTGSVDNIILIKKSHGIYELHHSIIGRIGTYIFKNGKLLEVD